MTVSLLTAAPDHQPWLMMQLQPYLSELSRFTDIRQDAEGNYLYPYLEHYWREPDRHPFVILHGDEPAGFVLVRQDLDPVDANPLMEIAELYILPDYRKDSVARNAIRALVACFPGSWRASVLEKNAIAYAFWTNVISGIDPDYRVTVPSPRNHLYIFSFRA